MGKVLCFGEALIDFLNTGHDMEGPISIARFRQFPGGAPANVAVAIAKLGGNASFAGQVGADKFGAFLRNTLDTYGVDTRNIMVHPTAPTPLAFVFLDHHGERSFEFYRHNTADILLTREQVEPIWFEDCTIAHVCSNTLVDAHILATTRHVLETARARGLLVSIDVNLRHNLWPGGESDRSVVRSVLPFADLIKASREEVDYLEPRGASVFARDAFASGARLVVITDGENPLDIYQPDEQFSIVPPQVVAVDTTAAGDAFVGGMLFKLAQTEAPIAALRDRTELRSLLNFAANCGAHTASRMGSMTALPTAELAAKPSQ